MAKKSKKKVVKKTAKKAAPRKAAKKAVKKAAKKSVKKVVKKAAKKAPVKSAKKKAAPRKKAAAAAPVKKAAAPKMSITPYLTFNGNCEEAFNFYRSVFGGEFPYIGRFKDMPPSDDMPPSPPEEGNRIMHVSLQIGDSWIFGSDSSDAFGQATVVGNNFSISLNATSPAEADDIYARLSNGGTQTMPMSHTFWGSYFGMLVDPFGIQWMISFEKSKS
jgi:PhnB protein